MIKLLGSDESHSKRKRCEIAHNSSYHYSISEAEHFVLHNCEKM